jgi:type VI secretion system secreted protein VgrG
LESAIVTGPSGETIYTDEYGRVKVRFHWDRADTPGERSTCWIRVSQTGGLGNVILPRVGHEVLVDFLDGDPDRPLIVGRVFNKAHMPTYELPANKTRAVWRTLTYGNSGSYPETEALDSGDNRTSNEIRFEDQGGQEELFIHAERDMNTRVRLAETHHVGQNQTIKVGYDRERDVVNDETVKIGRNQTLTVTGIRHSTVHQNDIIDVDHKFQLTAGDSIVLQVGASKIEMTPTSITLNSPKIQFIGTASVSATAPETTVHGDGTLTLTGGLVKIN